MKNLILFCLILSASAEAAQMASFVVIAPDRRATQVEIKNTSGSDQFCEDVEVNLTVAGEAFDDTIAKLNLSLGRVYIEKGESVQLNDVGAAEISQLSGEPKPWISNAQIRVQCHQATFADYCDSATKSSADTYTLNQILKVSGKSDCGSVEAKLKDRLVLSERNIESVRPLSFLTQLKRLDIAANKIMDLSPLKSLKLLERLDVSENPLDEIRDVLLLPSLRAIDASYTNVYYDEHMERSPTLKRVELNQTPYSKKVRRPK